MASPISVPGNQPNNSIAVNGANVGRRGSQSLSSFSPFSPPGATSVAAAAALGSSPPTATNMNMSASTTGSGFGAGFLGGSSGLARSISNGKQIGQAPLMSPTLAVNDKGARGQGILRRLSLGAGAARPNFGKPPAVVSPAAMPPAADNSVDTSQTDITSSTNYFNPVPTPQSPAAQSSTVATGNGSKNTSTIPSYYANPFSGAILHETHDEHEHDLVPGMSTINLGNRVPAGADQGGPPYRRASSAVTGQEARMNQTEVPGLPRTSGEPRDGTARPRKISFGWSGFMSGKKETGDQRPVPSSADAPRPRVSEPDSRPPVSILVRRESGPASSTGGGPGSVATVQQDMFKFGNGGAGETDKSPVSVTVQQVSLAPSIPSPRNDANSTVTTSSSRESTKGSPTTAKGSTGMLGASGGTGARGRRGSESGVGGGKKRSVSPMAEHILRGGPGQF